MPITGLDHYTIKTTDVEGTARFYEEVLGLERGPRPAFDRPLVWLYAGGRAVLHIVTRDEVTETDSGLIDHVAFRATGYREIKDRIEARGIEHTEQRLPQIGLHQLFAKCDDGTWVEMIFDPTDADGMV